MKQAFSEIDAVQDIKILRKSPTGRVVIAKVEGDLNDLVVTGQELRRRLGLKSTFVSFQIRSVDVEGQGSSQSRLVSSSPCCFQEPEVSFSSFRGVMKYFPNMGVSPYPIPPPLEAPPPVQELVLMARGFGSGHGVGMSQWGARALAKKGVDFRGILRHYYKDIFIRPYN